MEEDKLNLPKKVKKGKFKGKLRNVKVVERIKEKTKSKGKWRDNFGQKIRTFNEHLDQMFSDQLENEKRAMLIYTKLIDIGEFQTFIDEENKERMYIDWGDDFADSQEDIYAVPKQTRGAKERKGFDVSMQDKRLGIDQMGETYWENGYQTIDELKKGDERKRSPSSWKKLKKLFKSTGTERPEEEPADRSFFARDTLKEPIYEEIRPDLDRRPKDLKDSPKDHRKDLLKYQRPTAFEKPPVAEDTGIPPPPPLPGTQQSASSPESSSMKSTGFTPTTGIPPPPPMPGVSLTQSYSPTELMTPKRSTAPRPTTNIGIPPPPPMPGAPLTQSYSPTQLTSPKRSFAQRPLPPTPPSSSPEASLRSERGDRSSSAKKRTSRHSKRSGASFRNMFRRVSASAKHETMKIKQSPLTNLREDDRRKTTASTFKDTKIGRISRIDKM